MRYELSNLPKIHSLFPWATSVLMSIQAAMEKAASLVKLNRAGLPKLTPPVTPSSEIPFRPGVET